MISETVNFMGIVFSYFVMGIVILIVFYGYCEFQESSGLFSDLDYKRA